MFRLHPTMYELLTDETLLDRYIKHELIGADTTKLADWYNRGLITRREYKRLIEEAQNADEITA